MAKRTLEELQKQYTGTGKAMPGGPGGPGGPGRGPGRGPGGPGGPMARGLGGKPKDTKKTIKRLWSYMAKYKIRLGLVLILMLTHTLTTLFGSFMLAPIIDKSPWTLRKIILQIIFLTALHDKLLTGTSSPNSAKKFTLRVQSFILKVNTVPLSPVCRVFSTT